MAEIKNQYVSSLNLTHDLIGGKWKLRILWHIIHGDNRFSLLEKALPDITPKVLDTQLKNLYESGLIVREVVEDTPPKMIFYHISKEYQKLIPLVEAIGEFTTTYAKKNNIQITIP